jgi:hypothetical protein
MESVEEEKTGARPWEEAGAWWRRSEVRSEKREGKSWEWPEAGSVRESGGFGLDDGISGRRRPCRRPRGEVERRRGSERWRRERFRFVGRIMRCASSC